MRRPLAAMTAGFLGVLCFFLPVVQASALDAPDAPGLETALFRAQAILGGSDATTLVGDPTVPLNTIAALGEGSPLGSGGVGDYLERPRDLPETWGTEHFLFHARTPRVDNLSGALESAWRLFHRELGWPVPPSDGGLGGDERVDVYLVDLPAGVSGYAVREGEGAGPAAGFIVLSASLLESGCSECLLADAAHEYHHLVQFGFGFTPECSWFMEQTSCFMEHLAAPQAPDVVSYLRFYLERPWVRLDLCDGAHEYGSWLWPLHLADRFGHGVLIEIWREWALGGKTMLEATEAVLCRHGSSLDDEFLAWSVRNALLGVGLSGYALDGQSVSSLFREAVVRSYPYRAAGPDPGRWPQPLGCSLLEFLPDPAWEDNRLDVGASGCASLGMRMLVLGASSEVSLLEPGRDGEGVLRFEVPGWDEADRALLLVCNSWRAVHSCAFSVDAKTRFDIAGVDETTGGTGASGLMLSASPNPFGHSTVLSFELPASGLVRLGVLDAEGRLVSVLLERPMSPGIHRLLLSDLDRSRLPGGGIFFCRLQACGLEETLRLLRLK